MGPGVHLANIEKETFQKKARGWWKLSNASGLRCFLKHMSDLWVYCCLSFGYFHNTDTIHIVLYILPK